MLLASTASTICTEFFCEHVDDTTSAWIPGWAGMLHPATAWKPPCVHWHVAEGHGPGAARNQILSPFLSPIPARPELAVSALGRRHA